VSPNGWVARRQWWFFALALGSALLFTGPLYPAYAEQTARLFGLSATADQQLAGLLMIAEQLAAFVLCASFLLPALGRAPNAPRRQITTAVPDTGADRVLLTP